jgi:hypothetical protein
MTDQLDFQEIEKRVNQAVYQDGLLEVFLGAFLLILGVLFIVDSKLVAIGILLMFLFSWLLERVKKKYVYPRSGYVKLRPEKEADPKGIVLVALIAVVVLVGVMAIFVLVMGPDQGRQAFMRYIVPPATGLLMAIGPYWLAQTYGVRRGYVLAVLFILVGVLMPITGLASGYQAVGWECLVVGVVSLVTGAILFSSFIRRNPPAPIEEVPDASV